MVRFRNTENAISHPEPEDPETTRSGASTTTGDSTSQEDLGRDDATSGGDTDAAETVRRERDEYYDLLLRKQAEFENYRKRVERDRGEARAAAQAEVIAELLPVLDACEKGLKSMQSEASATAPNSFAEGYELLLRQLRSILGRYDVKEVPGVGAEFDPNLHEAVIREISRDFGEHEIVEEYRKGYTIGDRLLRPSQVKVAVWPDE
jgi:molecular chaperone GrpE